MFIREYSCWRKHPIVAAVCAFCVFTSVAMFVGILIVFLTTKNTSEFFVFCGIKIILLDANGNENLRRVRVSYASTGVIPSNCITAA